MRETIDRTQESELIPLAPGSLPAARRVLVLAPHADDEVFGCGGSLHLLARAGAMVSVIVASDGALGGVTEERDPAALIATREAEARQAAQLLGYGTPVFWRLPDRGLRYGEALVARVLDALRESEADLVFAPALSELHPDHQALSLAAAEALRRLGGERAIAFYEVSAPVLPNLLVDITAVQETKMAAMRCFRSQLEQQPYDEHIAALNRYRSYTLGAGVRSAEAFLLATAATLVGGLAPLYESALDHRRRLGAAVESSDVPLVSVVVRSMDRPTLSEVLVSLAAQTYPNIEVLVVNATGKPHSPLPGFDTRLTVRLLDSGAALRRSRAANVGLEAASGRFVMFLDDDDMVLPDHIARLTNAMRGGAVRAAYAGVRLVGRQGETLQEFDQPWVPAHLRGANYIPIHAVLFDRSLVVEGCRFDEGLECFEDWDFWLQVARHTSFAHVAGVSAIYRHVPGDSGAFAAMSVEEHLQHRARLLKKWHSIYSVAEWSETLHWFTQEREYALRHAAGLEEHIAGLKTHIAGLEEQIGALKTHVAGLSEQRAQIEAGLDAAQRQLTALYNSHSWKLTAPLRWLRSLFRRLGSSD